MSLQHGRRFLSIPGPTTVPDEVLRAMHRPAVDIYTGELEGITNSCLADLKKIFRTEGQTYIYAANGHGAWEAALTNTLSRGDRVLVLESGLFAVTWGAMARVMGVEVEVLSRTVDRAVDPAMLEKRLKADQAGTIKAVLTVQVDTASGAVNDVPAIRAAMDKAGHDALLMVDAIASLGCLEYHMDDWRVDVTVTGAQKGLMMTPGLSFVAAGPRAKDAHKTAGLITHYWDWTFREGPVHYQKYCGTPPEHMLFGLRKALDLLLDEGLENAWHRHTVLAGAVRAAVAKWAEGGAFDFNMSVPDERSNSVTTVAVTGFDPADLLKFCEETCGVTLGITIGPLDGKGFRIAHMGHVNAPMVLGTLGAIDVALKALGIPHGEGGLAAAAAHMAACCQA